MRELDGREQVRLEVGDAGLRNRAHHRPRIEPRDIRRCICRERDAGLAVRAEIERGLTSRASEQRANSAPRPRHELILGTTRQAVGR